MRLFSFIWLVLFSDVYVFHAFGTESLWGQVATNTQDSLGSTCCLYVVERAKTESRHIKLQRIYMKEIVLELA